MSLLEIDKISTFYGDVQVIFDLSLRVEKGEVVSIIGGNGAGKSKRRLRKKLLHGELSMCRKEGVCFL